MRVWDARDGVSRLRSLEGHAGRGVKRGLVAGRRCDWPAAAIDGTVRGYGTRGCVCVMRARKDELIMMVADAERTLPVGRDEPSLAIAGRRRSGIARHGLVRATGRRCAEVLWNSRSARRGGTGGPSGHRGPDGGSGSRTGRVTGARALGRPTAVSRRRRLRCDRFRAGACGPRNRRQTESLSARSSLDGPGGSTGPAGCNRRTAGPNRTGLSGRAARPAP